MADSTSNIYIDISGDGATMATDFGKGSEVGLTASHVSLTKMVWGDYNDNKRVTLANALPVKLAGQTGAIDISGNISGTALSSFPIKNYGQDGSGSSGSIHYMAVAGSTNGVSPIAITGHVQGIVNGTPIEITGDIVIRGSLDASRGVAIQGTTCGTTASVNGEIYGKGGFGVPIATTGGRRLHSDTDSINVSGTINSTGGRQLAPATDSVSIWGHDQGKYIRTQLWQNDGVSAGWSGDSIKVAITNITGAGITFNAVVSAVTGVTNASEPPLRIQGATASANADPVIVRGENNGALEIVATTSLSTSVSNTVAINDDDIIAYLGGPLNSSVTTAPIITKLGDIEKDTSNLSSIRNDLSSGKIKATVSSIERPSSFKAQLVVVREVAHRIYGSLKLNTGITIKAGPNNDDNILVGDVTLQNSYKNGYMLEPGESIFIEVDNLNKVYVKSDGSGDNDCYYIGS